MSRLIAIHQPNFFPWLGYFAKIATCDAFVFFDDVQFPKTGGVWTNRIKLLIGSEARWVTAAIDRNYHGLRTVKEIHFKAGEPWREKLLKTIEANYRRHPNYAETMEAVEPLLLNQESNIAKYNIHSVTTISKLLGLNTEKLYSSSDLSCTGSSNALLCSITKSLGGSSYLCGGGATGYQSESIFKKQGVLLQHQNFVHPIYTQRNVTDFVPGLSIIDALMNLGFERVGQLLRYSDD